MNWQPRKWCLNAWAFFSISNPWSLLHFELVVTVTEICGLGWNVWKRSVEAEVVIGLALPLSNLCLSAFVRVFSAPYHQKSIIAALMFLFMSVWHLLLRSSRIHNHIFVNIHRWFCWNCPDEVEVTTVMYWVSTFSKLTVKKKQYLGVLLDWLSLSHCIVIVSQIVIVSCVRGCFSWCESVCMCERVN